MAASLDIVNILNYELPKHGIPASTVASLAGISSGKLSSYLNEVVRAPHDHEVKLRRVWTQLKKLVEFSHPLPLDFRKVGSLRKCIEMMENETLMVIVSAPNESETTVHQ